MLEAIGNMALAIMIFLGGIIFIVANVNYEPNRNEIEDQTNDEDR